MQNCKQCNKATSSGYVICDDCYAKIATLEAEIKKLKKENQMLQTFVNKIV